MGNRLKHVLTVIFAYSYLYTFFIGTLYDFALNAWVCDKPIGLLLVITKTLAIFALFCLINHTIIKKMIGLKPINLFEIILLISIIIVALCYIYIEFHFQGDYSAKH